MKGTYGYGGHSVHFMFLLLCYGMTCERARVASVATTAAARSRR